MGQKRFVEGVESKTLLRRFHSVRPLLICNFHTYTNTADMEKVIKSGERYIHLLFCKFEATLKKIVAHVSALG